MKFRLKFRILLTFGILFLHLSEDAEAWWFLRSKKYIQSTSVPRVKPNQTAKFFLGSSEPVGRRGKGLIFNTAEDYERISEFMARRMEHPMVPGGLARADETAAGYMLREMDSEIAVFAGHRSPTAIRKNYEMAWHVLGLEDELVSGGVPACVRGVILGHCDSGYLGKKIFEANPHLEFVIASTKSLSVKPRALKEFMKAAFQGGDAHPNLVFFERRGGVRYSNFAELANARSATGSANMGGWTDGQVMKFGAGVGVGGGVLGIFYNLRSKK